MSSLPKRLVGQFVRKSANEEQNVESASTFPKVIDLNVGGVHFTTSLSTLRKYEDSMLAAMFSGRHNVVKDASGCYFIDSDGTYFGHVLNFLRRGQLPPLDVSKQVYLEAQYFGIEPLASKLRETPPIIGESRRQHFLGQFPNYFQTVETLIRLAKETEHPLKSSTVLICLYRKELVGYSRPHKQARYLKMSSEDLEKGRKLFNVDIHVATHDCKEGHAGVNLGPWEVEVEEKEVFKVMLQDLRKRGYSVRESSEAKLEVGKCQWSHEFGQMAKVSCGKHLYGVVFEWW
ncbi:PREDICTED: BTB/POZ domain-containing protein KCTD7-like [Branchiostoma belcheri]|uniref:BTB/POZ domain-containing protein KCTD7 n=1 Tax=Branchiostoma belcheri TaxID=7741 RepID=A0A6P4ZUW9_BRABE|nr:PREDICTED: BTB/POZ domain-containing protein KCTD7-like [Branchiostoma belcheri]